jgi:hypothetical protein
MRSTMKRCLLVVATLAPLGLLVLLAPVAPACPFCDGGPSGVNEVRAGIFDSHFWPRVAATLAPFPILASLVALIYFVPPGRPRPLAEAAASPTALPDASPRHQ